MMLRWVAGRGMCFWSLRRNQKHNHLQRGTARSLGFRAVSSVTKIICLSLQSAVNFSETSHATQ